MLQRICLVSSVCAIAFFLGRGLTQAGWDGLGLTNAHDASSLVISVKKKKKHHDDDDNADNNDNGPETPKVDQASCAKEGLQYVAGAGDKCYCPNGFVNKGTGLLVATHRSDCVTAKSYNQLDSTGAQDKPAPSKQYCEGYGNMNGVDYFKANCTGQHSGQFDCKVDSLNPTTHYHCCCYYH
jgi:hypothetical protein